MKPVLILQNLSGDGPAYLARWLQRKGLPCQVFNAEAGDPFPGTLDAYSALAILGGEMSANDSLPSLRQAEALVRQGVERGIPTLGHCLGGQLMARALGAAVTASPAPEIGWQPIDILDSAESHSWFGQPGRQIVFQWHFEAFDLPRGAERLACSPVCTNEAFAIGPHLAMQFHVEIDEAKLLRWSFEDAPTHLQALGRHASVQSGAGMRADLPNRLPLQQALADRIYALWLSRALDR
jgi:GMP synthase-like glutamine amidotransferase